MKHLLSASKGYVGVTDPDWYSFLVSQPRIDEVNFWRPHGNIAFKALDRGDPFFFKLKMDRARTQTPGAIAGFGFFERFEILPAWLAWDCFSQANGAPDFETMVNRLALLRGESGPDVQSGNFRIGCIMLSAPVFFTPDECVRPPADWSRTGTQQGKTYSLAAGEGRRLLDECLSRALTSGRYWNVERRSNENRPSSERYGSPVLVRPRLGQGLFCRLVRDAYDGSCAVTHEHSEPVLEAAHIRPYALGGEHHVSNGLLLRRDLHRLYDLGYVTVSPDHRFLVSDSLRDEYHNGRTYYELHGSTIRVPDSAEAKPDKGSLIWHYEERFRS